MNRRAFFGMSAGAIAAVPAVAAPELLPPPHYQKLSLALLDTAAAFGEMKGAPMVGRVRPFPFSGEHARDRYVYRTGNPAIDCLRSVSGVYRDRMERRAAEASR